MRLLVFFSFLCGSLAMAGQGSDSLFFRAPLAQIALDAAADRAELDNEGNIYLLETAGRRLSKRLAATGWDSVRSLGGASARDEGLIEPVKVCAGSRQQVLVFDAGKRSVLVFSRDLRLVSERSFLLRQPDERGFSEELLPSDFAAGPANEWYIANQLNNRILKLNPFGEAEAEFGGPDAGPGAVYAISGLEASADNLVYVADARRQLIQVYDNFGIWRYTLRPGYRGWTRMRLAPGGLLLFSERGAALCDPAGTRWLELPLPTGCLIRDLAMRGNRLCLLTKNAVSLYEVNP